MKSTTTTKCQHFLVTSELVLLQVVDAQIRKSISKVLQVLGPDT